MATDGKAEPGATTATTNIPLHRQVKFSKMNFKIKIILFN
jgi:hypothetical protein